jgi:hypothetical protein
MAKITISEYTVTQYQGSRTPATARLYASETFVGTDGTQIIQGSMNTPDFYREVAITDNSGALVAGAFSGLNKVESTNVGDIDNGVRYTLALYDSNGKFIVTLFENIRIYDDIATTTWQNIDILSRAINTPRRNADYATNQLVQALFNTLMSAAQKATSVLLGVMRLSVPADDSADPVAFGENDPAVTRYNEYATAGLPSSPFAGSLARVTDETRGLWRYQDRWMPQQPGRIVDALDFCDTSLSDNTSRLQAMIDAVAALGGGTIIFPAETIRFASQLNLVNKYNISFIGTSGRHTSSPVNLEFTGSGSDSAFKMESSSGHTFRGLHIQYTNATYSGWLMQTGHHPNGGNGDSQYIYIEDCCITGTSSAHGAAGLIDLNYGINCVVQKNHFRYAQKGLRGFKDSSGYSYINKIRDNICIDIEIDIWNPDEWLIEGNTFEPHTDGKTRAISGDGSNYARALVVLKNHSENGVASTDAHYNFVKCLGLTFDGNLGGLVGSDFVKLQGCQGFTISNCSAETNASSGDRGIIIDDATMQNYAGLIHSNHLNVGLSAADAIVGAASIGVTLFGNERGGTLIPNQTSSSLKIVGGANGASDTIDSASLHTLIGIVRNSIDTNGGAAWRVSDGSISGYPGGEVFLQSGNSGNGAGFTFWGDGGRHGRISPLGLQMQLPMGYATGAGGTITQNTNKSTAVTLNKVCGQITLNNAALAADAIVTFDLNNTLLDAGDVLIINHVSGGTVGKYHINAQCINDAAHINVTNISGGSLGEAIVLQYVLIKAVSA